MTVKEMIQNIPGKVLDAIGINPGYIGMYYSWQYNDTENCYQSDNGSKITTSSLTIKNSRDICHYEYHSGRVESFYEYFSANGWWGNILKRECSKDKVTLMTTTSEGVNYIIKFSADNEDPFIFSVSTVSKESLEEVSLGFDFMNRLTISALRQTFGEECKSETESKFVSCDDPLEVVSFILNHPELKSILQYFSNALNERYYLDSRLIEDFPEQIIKFMTIVKERICSNVVDIDEEITSVLKFVHIAPISREIIAVDTSDLPF